jgi:hypothetical protein
MVLEPSHEAPKKIEFWAIIVSLYPKSSYGMARPAECLFSVSQCLPIDGAELNPKSFHSSQYDTNKHLAIDPTS